MKCSNCENCQKCQPIRKKNHILNRLVINKFFSTQSYNWGHLVGECCNLPTVSVKASGRETSWPCRSIQNHQGKGKSPQDPITMPRGLCRAWLTLFTHPASLQDCQISPKKMTGQNIYLLNLKNSCLFFRIPVIINRCILPRTYSKGMCRGMHTPIPHKCKKCCCHTHGTYL